MKYAQPRRMLISLHSRTNTIWVSVQSFLCRTSRSNATLAHEGNGIIYTPLTFGVPYCNTRSCNPRRCTTCAEDEGTKGSSAEGTRAYTHRRLASDILHKSLPTKQALRLS